MLKVGVLIKYLNENNSSSTNLSPVEQTFLNYLTVCVDHQATMTSDTVDNFFRHCLEYPHWQKNRSLLGQEIRDLLSGEAREQALIPDLEDVKWPEDTQILELENFADVPASIEVYLNSVLKNGEKFRLVADSGKKVYAIILKPDGSLQVQIFDNKMILRNGKLEPLRKDLSLFYSKDLELASGCVHKIEVAPYSIAQFSVERSKVSGSLIRGYTFQKSFEFEQTELEKLPKLFYAVKRAEQHFLSRESDPFYQNTLKTLENTIQGIQRKSPESLAQATDIMAKAQNALEYSFTGDRVLTMLLRDLQRTLAFHQRTVVTIDPKAEAARNSQWNNPSLRKQQNQQPKWSDSTNLSPIAESPAVELLID
jgi:hypothetical protein